jgi:hypothetical protein
MDNPETQATLGTQDTGRRQTKYNNNKKHTSIFIRKYGVTLENLIN